MATGRSCGGCGALLLALLTLLAPQLAPAAGRASPLDDQTPAGGGCTPRPDYPFSVMQMDEAGRACWGQIRVMTCWGHCRSNEVPDWRFPYKRSDHPVCIHDLVQLRKVTLENCEPGAAAGTASYEYLDAVSCKCNACDSSLASCEGSKYRSTRSWSPGRR